MGIQTELLINKSTRPIRIVRSVVTIFIVLLFCWFGVRTQIANMLAELTSPSSADANEVAQLAMSMSPTDPRSRWLSAMSLRRSFVPEDIELSVRRLEETAVLNPHDFRVWTDLARAYEQSEKIAESEVALKHSIDLAPKYALPRWQMANFLIRQGRPDEAKEELKLVTRTSSSFRQQAFSLAWELFGKNPSLIEEINSPTAEARAELAYFFVQQGLSEESLHVWNQLSETEKATYSYFTKPMAQMLLQKGFALESLALSRDGGMTVESEPESLGNGGFESPIGEPDEQLFGWRLFRYGERFEALQVSSEYAEGRRAVRLIFRNYSKPGFFNVSQVVAVRPEQRYRLSFKVRQEDLRSSGMPLVDIASIKDYQTIARTEPFEIGSYDWKEISLEFVVPFGVQGIDIRTLRVECGEGCSISGSVWFDDFKLVRV